MQVKHSKVDVVITLHAEGLLAYASLCSFERSRLTAEAKGIEVRFIFVHDCADNETQRVVAAHPAVRVTDLLIYCEQGDPASARNLGVAASDAIYLCTLDADDLISLDYFQRHVEMAGAAGKNVVLHPEIVVSFGMYNAFSWQLHQPGEYYDKHGLLTVNPWISAAFARRELFLDVSFQHCDTAASGFGYEDWHWNCETIARGISHELAWGTIYFYRRKWKGSRNENANIQQALVAPSQFFATLGLEDDE